MFATLTNGLVNLGSIPSECMIYLLGDSMNIRNVFETLDTISNMEARAKAYEILIKLTSITLPQSELEEILTEYQTQFGSENEKILVDAFVAYAKTLL